MTEETELRRSFPSKRRSRWVTMPTAFRPTTTGTPEMPRERVTSSTSRIVMLGETVIGSLMTPLSEFLHARRPGFEGLGLDGHALVNDADAAFLREGDREARCL